MAGFRPVIDGQICGLAESEADGIEVHLSAEGAVWEAELGHAHPQRQDPRCDVRETRIERGVGLAGHGEIVVGITGSSAACLHIEADPRAAESITIAGEHLMRRGLDQLVRGRPGEAERAVALNQWIGE